ncbi:hypothetical protein CHS0354_036598 [Potamilus streckersoni]|uniref:Uncharacterized protein n=1 Tax=Potamilus streckersoni TaxID=2493646 RepID=A0AAE0WCN7_9BIVA|nr:hypothetical protein CHS0354_036598 [Potamilus streckersoni]
MHSSTSFYKRLRLLKKELYFLMVCVQIVILNHKIVSLQKHYKKTNQDNMQSLRHNIRLHLAAEEGVRDMFYDVANKTANQIAKLRRELFGDAVHILTKSAMEDIAENRSICGGNNYGIKGRIDGRTIDSTGEVHEA